MTADSTTDLSTLPRVDAVLDAAEELVAVHGHRLVRDAVRAVLARTRTAMRTQGAPPPTIEQVVQAAGQQASSWTRVGPRRVVNAAGVVVHTNLGRAPLSTEAVEAVVQASGYCDLEFDLDHGVRGSRGDHVDGLLARASGAEDAMVVNNCAAALVLVLTTLAHGRQVPVSRGHLVEIGGSFRLPEIMASSGARLLEVGTTNRTRASDYEAGDDVGALLTVHPSNFTQDGFVTQPSLAAVAAVARARGVPLVHDAGSGLLARPDVEALSTEPSIADDLAAGADLVLASGDKLLGGPQAGLVMGRADLVGACREHPLARALRVDKLRLAALSATLVAWLRGDPGPVVATLATPAEVLLARVTAVAAAVGGAVGEASTVVGGGSAPGHGVTSPVVALHVKQPLQVAAALRGWSPPVVARVSDQTVLLDLRTVDPDDDEVVIAAARAATAVAG